MEWFKSFTAETWVAFAAALIAFIALYFTGLAAGAARQQTKIQRQLRIDAAQPYIWVDIREDDVHTGVFHFVIGNSGPTVATNVRVLASQPLPAAGTSDPVVSEKQAARIRELERRLAEEGLASIAPGRVVRWALGIGEYIYAEKGRLVFKFTIHADGPFGPLEPLTYTVDMDDWKYMVVQPEGSLKAVERSISALTKQIRESSD